MCELPDVRYPWHIYHEARSYPFLPEEEDLWVGTLEVAIEAGVRHARGCEEGWDRSDVTILLTMLRCGISIMAVRRFAPGLCPGRILEAYRMLHKKLVSGRVSVARMLSDPNNLLLPHVSHDAARLLPSATWELTSAVINKDENTAAIVNRLTHSIIDARVYTDSLYRRIRVLRQSDPPAHPNRLIELGVRLYTPVDTEPSAWAGQHFLPDRVGEIIPSTAADLLGENDWPLGPAETPPPGD